MAINKNHEFEELDGIKCGIVEKNIPAGRVEFLKKLLQYNGYTVVVVPTPPPKVVPPKPVPAAKAVAVSSETPEAAAATPAAPSQVAAPVPEALPPAPPLPETFTVGVTDYTFNPINAIFGRLLHTPDGHVVTQVYWHQKESSSHDEIPYYEHTL